MMPKSSGYWSVGIAAAVVTTVLLLSSRSGIDVEAAGTPAETSSPAAADPTGGVFRAFAADSWWNSALPVDAPTHDDSADILEYMSTARESNGGCITLAGAENSWGQPVFWADAEDTKYDVNVPKVDEPPELSSLRIPASAEAADTSDEAMTVFDVERGYVVALTGADYNKDKDSWRASGATVTYLDSNGLHARTGKSDNASNLGSHRGNNGATMMVRYDEFMDGAIHHVLKVASGPEMARRHVFPMVGSDGDSREEIAPPQGLRFRIKPSVDLGAVDLHPEARVFAQALQTYGFYLGDSAGTTALKLENSPSAGGGQPWTVPATGLCALPLVPEFWDVLAEGYDPS